MDKASQIIPDQVSGRETNFTHEKTCGAIASAHKLFTESAQRMLTIGNWDKYAGLGSAKFTLCNNQGVEFQGYPKEGNFISVDLPMTGPDAGDGLEWVLVEQIIAEGDSHTAEEYVAMTLRPAPDPRKVNDQIAHFFTDASTSTFVIRRDGKVVSAGVHGRNETPNKEDVDLHDKIRNITIALIARTGLSGIQWQRLVNGLIEYNGK